MQSGFPIEELTEMPSAQHEACAGPCLEKWPTFYRLVDQHYERFEQVYPERYEDRYGYFRPVIRETVYKYLGCGDLKQGFARVRCRDCGHEFSVQGSATRPSSFAPGAPAVGHLGRYALSAPA